MIRCKYINDIVLFEVVGVLLTLFVIFKFIFDSPLTEQYCVSHNSLPHSGYVGPIYIITHTIKVYKYYIKIHIKYNIPRTHSSIIIPVPCEHSL